MEEYAGRVLAERYRLPVRPSGDGFGGDGGGDAADGFEAGFDVRFAETRAFDTYSGQEVLARQVPLPEVVDAEVVGADTGRPGFAEPGAGAGAWHRRAAGGADRSPRDPVVRRALEAATTAARLPDHPLLDQVFDVFAQDGSLWIVGELLPARPLSALLAERTLSPHRAAEIAADVLTALRALHAHGWIHRNITARTVLICDDGRAVLTGLAAGAAQEALCGYDPAPRAGDGPAASAGGAPPDGISLVKQTRGAADDAPAPEEGHAGLTGLAAERARQARLQVVGAVTERWAPEQAGPVGEGAAPEAGPAVDLWAVGALLFRSVQGRPPFPEESAAELVRLVAAQPPAGAAECGALRPVVEALLCRDPAARPEFEAVRARLRALIRTAPEPDLGSRLVTLPALEQGADPRRLPIVRRRGELVRKGRQKKVRARGAQPRLAPAGRPAPGGRAQPSRPPRIPRQPKPLRPAKAARSAGRPSGDPYEAQELLGQVGLGRAPQRSRPGRAPRSLGRVLLTVILLLMVGGIAYAMVFLPKSGAASAGGPSGADLSGSSGAVPGGSPTPSAGRDGGGTGGASPGTGEPQTTAPGNLAPGYELRTDPMGFQVAVPKGWQRRAETDQGQVRYTGGDFELVVVPGRDTTARAGADPMAYQQDKEAELAPYRAAGWSSSSGLRRIDIGQTAMAEGTFTWRDGSGRQVYVRNLAMIHDGRYHVVMVIGPDTGRDEVDKLYEQASSAYRPN
ncbi:serine/threonine protein kinase [Streptomyces sp. GS7]|uniref:serine/threonine protein kinase n=1 Tax=Streptomyces sp. GS7 TaxID=2692234 RepID=UPI001316FD31|nr:protein kinase [Streptomyces sp. GS7]QHC20528.1 protein kinase [Streptomyces sp. GS7]